MALANDAWTKTHDLSLIFVALAYGTDRRLTEDEQDVIVEVLGEWQEQFPEENPEEIVIEALALLEAADDAVTRVIDSMQSLKTHLSVPDREQALEQIIRVAEADGVLLNTERSLISSLAAVWELKEAARQRLHEVTAQEEAPPAWSLMHDIALIYVVVAHSTDNNLSSKEIDAIIACFEEWQPRLSENEIRNVLRKALTYYASGPEQEVLEASTRSVRQLLSVGQRLAVLSDLIHIAEADGAVNRNEREIIGLLAEGWGVGIRFDADAYVTANGKVQ